MQINKRSLGSSGLGLQGSVLEPGRLEEVDGRSDGDPKTTRLRKTQFATLWNSGSIGLTPPPSMDLAIRKKLWDGWFGLSRTPNDLLSLPSAD